MFLFSLFSSKSKEYSIKKAMLIKSISKAESPTLEVYMAYGKSAEYQEYKLIMQHAVDGLGAPFPLVKRVCR